MSSVDSGGGEYEEEMRGVSNMSAIFTELFYICIDLREEWNFQRPILMYNL